MDLEQDTRELYKRIRKNTSNMDRERKKIYARESHMRRRKITSLVQPYVKKLRRQVTKEREFDQDIESYIHPKLNTKIVSLLERLKENEDDALFENQFETIEKMSNPKISLESLNE